MYLVILFEKSLFFFLTYNNQYAKNNLNPNVKLCGPLDSFYASVSLHRFYNVKWAQVKKDLEYAVRMG